VPMSNKSLW